MSDIWNLNALCRCCHTDGIFKSLQLPYSFDNNVEVYSVMLQEAIGVDIKPPPMDASYSICDECINNLRNALQFKRKVLECEQKFEEYCKNEQALLPTFEVKIEDPCSDNGDSGQDATPVLRDSDDYKTHDKCELKLDSYEDITQKEERMETKVNADDKIVIEDAEVKVEEFNDIKIEKKIKTKRKTAKKPSAAVKKKIKSGKKRNKKQEIEESLTNIDLTLIVPIKTETEDLYSCKICGGSYKIEKNIKRHILLTHTNPKLYKCEHCPKEYQKIHQFKAHIKKHGEKKFKCLYCNKQYHLEKVLLEHMNTHTRENVFTCCYCDKGFLYKQTLRRHMKLHLGTSKGHMCDICGNSFNDSTHLGIHIRTVHEKIRPYSCDVCHKSFAANKTLKIHYRKHTGETPYKCDICPQKFISFFHLKKHKMEHDLGTAMVSKYKCKVCNKQYDNRGEFSAHVMKHEGQKPFVCVVCNKDFSCKYTLKRHTNEHYGIKAYGCESCPKRFTQKIQLIRHIDKFHNERLFDIKQQCEMCRKFVRNLEKHVQTHYKKPFACEQCDKRYPERNALNRHVRNVHFSVRDHQCDLCHKKYTQATSLKKHKLKVHKPIRKIEDDVDTFAEILANLALPEDEGYY